MARKHKAATWLLLAGLLAAAVGCGRSNRVSIKGRVTLDGQPVGPGSIAFLPQPGTESVKVAAAIEEGAYEVPAELGAAPGSFKVEVRWSKKTGRRVPSADPGFTMEETREAIPPKYNSRTTLTIELRPGENVHDFPLKSQ